MIQADLQSARKQWLTEVSDEEERGRRKQSDFLAYRDSQDRYADFHALRHSYITMIGKTGVSPKEHQDLARHSTYNLTGRYTHSRAYDLAAAVQSLPIPFPTDSPERQAGELAATGTDGGQKTLGPNLGLKTACLRDKRRQPEIMDSRLPPTKNPGKQAVLAAFQGSRQDTSKVEDRGFEPLTS
jgi:hypothetical protein